MKNTVNPSELQIHPDGIGFPIRNPKSAIRNGFTLTEVMFAIMILGVGLIAIATIFPVASSIQKTTTDEIISLQVAENAKSILIAKGIPFVSIHQSFETTHQVNENTPVEQLTTMTYKVFRLTPFESANRISGPFTLQARFADIFMPRPRQKTPENKASYQDVAWFTEEDRSYPSTRPLRRPDATGRALTSMDERTQANQNNNTLPRYFPNRDYYWYPLFRRKVDGNWNCFVFIMHRIPESLIPQVEEVLIKKTIEPPTEDAHRGVTVVELDRHRDQHSGVANVTTPAGSLVAPDIQPGVWVLDSAGGVHRIQRREVNKLYFAGSVDISGNDAVESLWYGRTVMGAAAGDQGARRQASSPVTQILVMSNEVIRDDQP